MVGPGTGIAPFRSFWQQRQFDIKNKAPPNPRSCDVTPVSSPLAPRRGLADLLSTRKSSATGGEMDALAPSFSQMPRLSLSAPVPGWAEMVLFFGCRSSTHDHIYKEEMCAAKGEGALTEVFTALSREPNKPKVTVKRKIRSEITLINVRIFWCFVW